MNLQDAILECHVRSAIFREPYPETKFWKNHTESLISRIPDDWVDANDWEEYDPRDDDTTSLFMFND